MHMPILRDLEFSLLHRRLSPLVLGLLTAVAAEGCSDNGSGSPDTGTPETPAAIAGLRSLRVEPPMATITVQNGIAATHQFRAVGTFSNGGTRDITNEVVWSSDHPGRARVVQGLSTSDSSVGGPVVIWARAGTVTGSANLMVKLVQVFDDPAVTKPLPTNPGTKFGGMLDPARNPQLVYPNDSVLIPPNLFGIEIHFRPGPTTNTLFEVSFTAEYLDLRIFTRCQAPAGVTGCIFEPDRNAWTYLANSGRGAGPINVKVRATDDTGTTIGASDGVRLLFSEDDVRGAVYYWTTTGGSGIMRWDFGNKNQKNAEKVLGTELTGGTCVGCHALSRDGQKFVVGAGGQHDGRLLLFDVARKAAMLPFPLMQKSQFESWNPNGSQFVGVYGDGKMKDLILFDGTTGLVRGMIPLGGIQGDHPDWSEDGRTIAFTDVGQFNTDQKSYKGAIGYVQEADGKWGAPITLIGRVPGKNNYYPAISPTNEFLVYNQSTCPARTEVHADCDFDMDPTARLWAVPIVPSARPIDMAAANAPGIMDMGKTALTNSFPKWSPFRFELTKGRELLWVTFTSKRNYGLRGNGKQILIWMAAVESGRILSGEDPSYPAFALPFQDLASNNHIAQWTTKVATIE